MDIFIDIMVEILFEIFANGFMSAACVFFPNHTMSAKAERNLSIVFCLLGLFMFILLIVGGILLIDSRWCSTIGWVLLGTSVGYMVLALVLRLIKLPKK